ncbi:TRAP transporter permease [Oceanospirillum linum]|uniref:Transporter n=1 Tax=Oceanospirillum linum TaxID=966 RepID=A0A1T1HDS2_OCELI|nr:TRAP transporter permease [Oceanospirillum linum]OOV88011.1 transporter [Oceanospirillum linum]SEF40323.1 TRAP transporter, 4TM/12TM fusion protein [Oleiphilus messinensis]SMP00447.1 TRAP transporter, 4TM/12TM fusion protein [Oceanospirillum linum]
MNTERLTGAKPPTGQVNEMHQADLDNLIKEYDNESNFRDLRGGLKHFVTLVCVTLSLFHIYTAGFGLLNEVTHRTVHMTFIMGLLFLVFPRKAAKKQSTGIVLGLMYGAFYLLIAHQLVSALSQDLPPMMAAGVYFFAGMMALSALPLSALGGRGNKPGWLDWPLAILGTGFSLYLVYFFDEIFIINVGFPQTLDYLMGGVAILLVIEGARRTMGESLSIIGVLALLYAMFGPYLPGVLAHRGYDIIRLVEHLYLGTEGIYGIAIGVVATYVFHFVLFGVLAQASGLGQLFIELATLLAGRYSGGPAKVSVVSSGFFGMISGSPVANTVTTGAFTIPMMQRYGFSGRFAAATEAAASCGGQITPPIMGASAFVMAEMLGIPYNELILVAVIPAAFHYLATLCMVHFEARRLGLEGVPAEDIPRFRDVMARHWHQTIPLIVMVTLLLMQFTPFLAAFWGIILTVVCSYLPLLLKPLGFDKLDHESVLTPSRLVFSLEEGAKQSIAITAACACVGFLLGVTTLTGLGFKFSGAIVGLATDFGTWLSMIVPFDLLTPDSTVLFVALLLVAVACILMGAGIPTTPTYIILASIVAPALDEFGIALLASHFFIFYYGVLADVTPPVALAAYAGAGISGSDPMRTGTTAFRLSMGKALVPFMFVFAPSLLFLNFNWSEFILAMISGILCIFALSTAYIGYFRTTLHKPEKIMLSIAGLALVGSQLWLVAIAGSVVVAILLRNHLQSKERPGAHPA